MRYNNREVEGIMKLQDKQRKENGVEERRRLVKEDLVTIPKDKLALYMKEFSDYIGKIRDDPELSKIENIFNLYECPMHPSRIRLGLLDEVLKNYK